jgi:hypothetical protein
MKCKCLIVYLAFLLISFQIIVNDDDCEENSSKYLTYKTYPNTNDMASMFSRFNSFSDLSFSNSNNCSLIYNITSYLEFLPRLPCILDISVKKLFSRQQIIAIDTVSITNLIGFDIHASPLQLPSKLIRKRTILQIFTSYLEFYSNKHHINSSSGAECNLDMYNNEFNFLNSFYIVIFNNIVYPKFICPLAFKGSNITHIEFADVTNSFLRLNLLNFYILNRTQSILSITKSIKIVLLKLIYVKLDEKLFSKSLFKYITFLRIHGVLRGIESDLFKEFIVLKNIDFQLDNFKEFFHSGIKWMICLNKNVRYSNETEIIYKEMIMLRFNYLKKEVSFDPIYEYPDEDVCLFKEFPHERLVFPLIVSGKQLNCTCTLMWLQSNSQIYEGKVVFFKFKSL